MPLRRERYPADWEAISRRIRVERAGNRCEGSPRYPDCRAENGQPHPVTHSRVVLTVAHLDHDTTNNHDDNLRALCQRCHLFHDLEHHMANARRTRWLKKLGGQSAGLPMSVGEAGE